MSDNEDLLGDDLGDHSLADYNLGNEEEEQLLADDYESLPQNVPTSHGPRYDNGIVPAQFQGHGIEYGPSLAYQPTPETECVVPNIAVEVTNPPPENVHCTYAPYEPERAVPPAIPAGPVESPQIVPSDVNTNIQNDVITLDGDMGGPRERFMSERPPGVQRQPQIRDIPDSLDKVVIHRGGFPGRGRTTWVRQSHPYRRNYRGNYNQRMPYPPQMRLNHQHLRHETPGEFRLNHRAEMQAPLHMRSEMDPLLLPDLRPDIRMNIRPDRRQEMRPNMRMEMRPELRHDLRSDVHPDIHIEMRPDSRPDMRSDMRRDIHPELRADMRREMRPNLRPEMRSDLHPEMRPDIHTEMRPNLRPEMRSDLHPDMRLNLRQEMRSDLHPELRSDLRPEMRSDLRSDMRPNLRPEIRPDLRPDMRPDMRAEIRSDLHPEMRSDLHPELRSGLRSEIHSDLRPEMRADLHPDIRPNLRLKIPSDLHPEMRPDLHPEMRPDLRPDMRPDMRPDIRPDMRPDMRSEIHPDMRPDMRSELRPDIHPEMRSDLRPEMRPDLRPEIRPDLHLEMLPEHLPPPRQMGPDISPERPILPEMQPAPFRQQNLPRFSYRPPNEDRVPFGPNYEPRPTFQYQRAFPEPLAREITPNTMSHMPQVTIRQTLPNATAIDKDKFGLKIEPEVRMLPVQLPPNLPTSLPGKKVLINPHFKGNFQPPIEGLPAYIPTRIQKTPPLSPTLESKFGPIKDIDDAAERFIAEQRNALARAAVRKFNRRSPQRYIENTTIEIENELAQASGQRRSEEDDLLRRQEEFINANRAGLRRRMRSPTPPRRSPTPERRPRPDTHKHVPDEESEYRKRLREQERLRERVLRAKEVRRKKNAVAIQEREREILEKERMKEPVKVEKPEEIKKPEQPAVDKPTSTEADIRPDTTRNSPEANDKIANTTERNITERVRERSPLKKDDSAEVNSTCETMTPPRAGVATPDADRTLTPPLPTGGPPARPTPLDSDDELDLILEDIDGILSEDDDDKTLKSPSKSTSQTDLRVKIPTKSNQTNETKKQHRQKITFSEKDEKKRREKSPPRKPVVSSTKTDDNDIKNDKKSVKTPQKAEVTTAKNRQRIVFDNKKEKSPDTRADKKQFPNRRVVIQKKDNKSVFTRIETKPDPSKPNPGIFSRAVRHAIGAEGRRAASGREPPADRQTEPELEYGTESDSEEPAQRSSNAGNVASVANLPHGITDTRLRTLAGSLVQSLILDKDDRSAKITFKTSTAAETFKKKFNNKMVAASRLTVTLQ